MSIDGSDPVLLFTSSDPTDWLCLLQLLAIASDLACKLELDTTLPLFESTAFTLSIRILPVPPLSRLGKNTSGSECSNDNADPDTDAGTGIASHNTSGVEDDGCR
ncbi:hypothetical protein SERLA73DRAFT_71290 [Serpula lacrymans var. lacrymans S7.3]|uniref:Uncharacterized protein n=2 Tax=Serpula lacrymans var. lacrymans TaxID=341189 RepID=F8PPZ9_SERL3|nr:uncharacterized protein SERLADRAFT_435533 [Serpula lacrymans var. lacrymans S7.9]EGO02153.1 hypothetical protein SERLA73DRAFT_71290 [Serpula lacrymans var. lacrymans S7.3]EGO27777.1 hypothetical protein SERLADRAFT_435533 [Serpula lacrymans var. lacrymans S7.9]